MSFASIVRASSVAFAAGLALAHAAGAAVLPFTGVVTVEIANVAAVSWSGSGFATLNGSGGGAALTSIALPAGAFTTRGLTTVLTSPAAFPLAGVQITAANGAGTLARTAMGELRGTMPFGGVAKVCLFAPCGAPPPANLSVPLSVVGAGGQVVATGIGGVQMTVIGAPWTTGVAAIELPYPPGLTLRAGDARGPNGQPGTTARPGGTVQLVTPVVVRTNISADAPIIPVFVRVSLQFVPEPSTALLALGGLALLGTGARRAAQRR